MTQFILPLSYQNGTINLKYEPIVIENAVIMVL